MPLWVVRAGTGQPGGPLSHMCRPGLLAILPIQAVEPQAEILTASL